MRLKILYIAITSVLLVNTSFAQNLEQTYSIAVNAYKAGNYESAVSLFNRVLYFSRNDTISADAYNKIADCYFIAKDFERAIYYYDFAIKFALNDSIKEENIFRLTTCYLLNGEYNMALVEMLSNSFSDPFSIKRQNFFLGNIYYELGDYENAKGAFVAVLDKEEDKIELTTLLEKTSKIRTRKGIVYFSIIPGLGQFLLGDPKNGIISLSVNSGFALLFFTTAISYSFGSALLTVFPWLQRYYFGGFKNAKKVAERKRLQKKDKLKKEVILYIKNHS